MPWGTLRKPGSAAGETIWPPTRGTSRQRSKATCGQSTELLPYELLQTELNLKEPLQMLKTRNQVCISNGLNDTHLIL